MLRRRYDVYLSFRAEDTRANFSSHLYAAMVRRGIKTYIDDSGLKRGDGIGPSLWKAIEESTFAVIIFSQNYASSKLCLDELVHILYCKEKHGQIVIPIYYGIDPVNVRLQRGSYAKAFIEHEERFKDKMEKVAQWRTALSSAVDLPGFVSENIRDESKLVEKVLDDIVTTLNRQSSRILTGLVGIESRIQKIELLLCIDAQDVSIRTIGIWGMGGIGKTTLADVVFHRLYGKFEACCFFAYVRGRTVELEDNILPKELVRVLLDEDIPFKTPAMGDWVKERLSRMKVLIVLDDVIESRQIHFLKEVQFGPGSRIIITSRDRRILGEWIYEVEMLNCDEAYQLLDIQLGSSGMDRPKDKDYEIILRRVVDYTRGIPFIIKFWGTIFKHYSRDDWESALNQLERASHPTLRIQKVLKVSYDSLDWNSREIFLDIACFLKGEQIGPAKRMLDACGFFADDGIEVLSDKALISVKDNCLWMHDLLQLMGKEIVEEECPKEAGKRSRLCTPEDVCDVLTKDMGTAEVQSILLDMSNIVELKFSPRAFRNMDNLRYLKLCNFLLEKSNVRIDDLEYLPDALRYLYWPTYPSKSLPSEFYPSNLVELHMPNSKLQRLWKRGQNPEHLKFLDLSYSKELVEVPDLSKSLNIQSINLQGCTDLIEVPSYFQSFHNLKSLNLRNCARLRVLSEMPQNMEFLDVGWTAIEGLPSTVWSLEKLVKLILNSCQGIKNLSSSTWNLNSLTSLDLAGTSINGLPSSIECLSGVVSIKLKDCRSLLSLPTTICKLKSIKKLSLTRCYHFESFPEVLERMEYLDILRLSHTAIKGLPSSIENLVGLRTLELSGCRSLEFIPHSIYNLNLLEKIKLDGCGGLTELPLVRNSSVLYGWQPR